MALIVNEPDVKNVRAKIDPGKIHSEYDIDDDAGLQLVVQDADRADKFIDDKRWTLRWRESDTLYQPPIGVQVWENTTVPRANIIRFTVATHVNSILPKLINGLFYEDPPFLLRPRPGTTQNTIRAISAVLGTQLDEMEVQEEVRRAFFNALVFGTLILKWGWRTKTVQRRIYSRREQPMRLDLPGKPLTLPTKASDEFEIKEIEEFCSSPFIESKLLPYVLIDPACRLPDIRTAGWVCERMYLNFYDLEKLADEVYYDEKGKEYPRYNLPSREEVKSWFEQPKETTDVPNTAEQANQNTNLVHHAAPRYEQTGSDPLTYPLEVLERWDNGKVLTVLEKKRLIRNEMNEFGCIPYLSCNWWDIPDAFYGLGLGRVLGQDQRVQQGLINGMLDLTSLAINPIYLRNAGANPPTQGIRQRIGGIYDVTGDVDKAFKILEQPRLDPAIFAEIQQSEARAESTSGAQEQLVMGSMPAQGRTSMGRTATGAGALSAATESRIGGFIENFNRQVYQPLLEHMYEMDRQKLPLSDLRRILKENADNDFKLEDFKEEDFLNAKFKFEVLAGSHLAAKQQMAQSMVMMVQLFENPPLMQQLSAQGKKVDIEELFHMLHDMSGFKNYYDVIKQMTPQDQQRTNMQNPALMAAQAQSAKSNQDFQHKQALIDQENEARAARDVLRMQLEHATRGETVEGEPTGTGFGSQEEG